MCERKYFYTVEPVMVRVTKEEYENFINSYPRKLTYDVCGICDPPAVSWNDFELANRWPYSVVATTSLYDDDPEDYFYEPEDQRVYTIMQNYKDCFNSKTGFKATD